MKTAFTGQVIGGALKLDEPIELADTSRVYVTVVPIESANSGWAKALDGLEQLHRERPIDSGGLRFSREELHERR